MPGGVRKVFDDELRKLQEVEPAVSEANMTRDYLDWSTQVCSSILLRCNIRYMNVTDTLGASFSRTLLRFIRRNRAKREPSPLERPRIPHPKAPPRSMLCETIESKIALLTRLLSVRRVSEGGPTSDDPRSLA